MNIDDQLDACLPPERKSDDELVILSWLPSSAAMLFSLRVLYGSQPLEITIVDPPVGQLLVLAPDEGWPKSLPVAEVERIKAFAVEAHLAHLQSQTVSDKTASMVTDTSEPPSDEQTTIE